MRSPKQVKLYSIIAIAGLILSALLLYYYLHFIQDNANSEANNRVFYLMLIVFGVSVSAVVFGIMNTYAVLTTGYQNVKLKMIGPGVGVALVVLGGFYLPPKAANQTISIRIFDHNKKPILQGNVKIYLKEYIRSQSVDNMGQALFTGIPEALTKNKLRVEITSPGYTMQTFDTLLTGAKPLELIMPLTPVVYIAGRITTAADMPIKNVEVTVDGTKYYAMTVNDGTYNLRLEEYTLGDEISITTSHAQYEDKTISLTIDAPHINRDIVLNPVVH